jgi:two-component system, NtrC family, sensor kinase
VFRNLSYHYKTPLSLVLVIALTALIVSATLMFRAYDEAKRELVSSALELGKTLSRTLRPALLHDEMWQAYEIITTPLDGRTAESRDRVIAVLDPRLQIYVSSVPTHLPALNAFESVGSEFARVARRIAENSTREPFAVDQPDAEFIHVVVPVLAEDRTPLGTLVLSSSRGLFLPQFYSALRAVFLSTAIVLAILVPIGWYWGKRMARPLEYLAQSMAKVGREPVENLRRGLPAGRDEIGVLSASFSRMLEELEEKKAMERQMLASERLAAIGRLTAGISHEINNPLGGMLNAISTFKKRGTSDPAVGKTMSLLERGLTQIRETVSALLVEARLENHALTPQDIEDTRTLVSHDAQHKHVQLLWQNELEEPLPIPSTPVRQILLNLLLNAVAAVEEKGRLECRISRANGGLRLSVANDGTEICRQKLEHLYEPFAAHPDGPSESNGLGLWVTYQLVQQLKGSIEASSAPGRTEFSVSLPVGESA